eukprot:ANDGO_02503.mRNA.1 hypothetical protein
MSGVGSETTLFMMSKSGRSLSPAKRQSSCAKSVSGLSSQTSSVAAMSEPAVFGSNVSISSGGQVTLSWEAKLAEEEAVSNLRTMNRNKIRPSAWVMSHSPQRSSQVSYTADNPPVGQYIPKDHFTRPRSPTCDFAKMGERFRESAAKHGDSTSGYNSSSRPHTNMVQMESPSGSRPVSRAESDSSKRLGSSTREWPCFRSTTPGAGAFEKPRQFVEAQYEVSDSFLSTRPKLLVAVMRHDSPGHSQTVAKSSTWQPRTPRCLDAVRPAAPCTAAKLMVKSLDRDNAHHYALVQMRCVTPVNTDHLLLNEVRDPREPFAEQRVRTPDFRKYRPRPEVPGTNENRSHDEFMAKIEKEWGQDLRPNSAPIPDDSMLSTRPRCLSPSMRHGRGHLPLNYEETKQRDLSNQTRNQNLGGSQSQDSALRVASHILESSIDYDRVGPAAERVKFFAGTGGIAWNRSPQRFT